MARVQIILDIEEADLKQFMFREGCALPTNVIKFYAYIPSMIPTKAELAKLAKGPFYRFQHATNQDAEEHALTYRRAKEGAYPDGENQH